MNVWKNFALITLTLFCLLGGPARGEPPEPFYYGMNYYPRSGIWDLMWESYRPEVVEADFDRLASLGFNSVRIFLQFSLFDAKSRDRHEASLKHLLDAAERRQLRVLVTLFDWTRPYDPAWQPDMLKHLRRLVAKFNSHPALLGWDLKNEADLDYRFYATPEPVDSWIRQTLPELKRAAGEKPVTVGWLHPPLDASVDGAADFLSFHHYEGPEKLAERLAPLQKSRPGIPWVLEEFGFATVRGIADEAEQTRRLLGAIRETIDRGGRGVFLWALHDFEPGVGRERPAAENHFGLYDVGGRAKHVVKRLVQPCTLYYPSAGTYRDRMPLARKELTACVRGSGKTVTLVVNDAAGKNRVIATQTLPSEKSVHCPTFSVGSLWWGLVGRGFTLDISLDGMTTLGGAPAAGHCHVAVDDYF